MATTRRLAAIMFTDITGYSAMMQANEMRARMIRNRHREVFKDAHNRYGGTILQYFGDGTLSIFNSTSAAVECAVEMQIEFRREPEVPLRIGIHSGDISYDDEGAYGDGLNIAARVERLCIPGGIYITAKVYDDIKNHAWLTAMSLGLFQLRNINREIELFAITCKGMVIPAPEELRSYPERTLDPGPEIEDEIVGTKSKYVAGFLAFFLGLWGIHKFYLGRRFGGIVHFIIAVVALNWTIQGNWSFPPIAVVAIVAFIESILLFVMPRRDFDLKYNRRSKSKRRKVPQRVSPRYETLDRTPRRQGDPAIVEGINFYKQDKYHDAIDAFRRALLEDPRSSAAHFNLACCFAILHDAENAYMHLAKAVQLGFDDKDRIMKHEALDYLRADSRFDAFVANGFKVVAQLPEPEPDLLNQPLELNTEVIDRLELLGEKLEAGELTRDEFELQKQKLLGH